MHAINIKCKPENVLIISVVLLSGVFATAADEFTKLKSNGQFTLSNQTISTNFSFNMIFYLYCSLTKRVPI